MKLRLKKRTVKETVKDINKNIISYKTTINELGGLEILLNAHNHLHPDNDPTNKVLNKIKLKYECELPTLQENLGNLYEKMFEQGDLVLEPNTKLKFYWGHDNHRSTNDTEHIIKSIIDDSIIVLKTANSHSSDLGVENYIMLDLSYIISNMNQGYIFINN